MTCSPVAIPLCNSVKMTILPRQDSSICTPKRNLLEIYDSHHVRRKRFVTYLGPLLSKSQTESHGLRMRFSMRQAITKFS